MSDYYSLADEVKAGRTEAARIEEENPLWIVVFGIYSRQFICLPLFDAPAGTMLIAQYPQVLPERMASVEQLSRVRKGLRRGSGQ